MVELKVTGMTCDGCANSVKRAIMREFPGASVQVDLAAGLVRIDGEVEQARAEVSIKKAGYGIASPSA
jgi:copper chaperone